MGNKEWPLHTMHTMCFYSYSKMAFHLFSFLTSFFFMCRHLNRLHNYLLSSCKQMSFVWDNSYRNSLHAKEKRFDLVPNVGGKYKEYPIQLGYFIWVFFQYKEYPLPNSIRLFSSNSIKYLDKNTPDRGQ